MSLHKKSSLAFLLIIGCFLCQLPSQAQVNKKVYVISLNDDTINPVTAEYISKSIEGAVRNDAVCLVIKLDTPGGLLSSTRTIVKNILSSRVPVVVYIAPSGSRAGSAGVFITYASHVAAMSPSTNIGAAHPVEMGGGEKKEGKKERLWEGLQELLEATHREKQNQKDLLDETGKNKDKSKSESVKSKDSSKSPGESSEEAGQDVMSSKILEDTVAFIRAIAKQRNRNIAWAIKSVTESSSITETEALELGVIEIIAKDEKELLDKLNGRVVTVNDKVVTLETKDAAIVNIEMDFRQRFLNVLANPNIAYIFLILGFWGLLYEITHPGIGVPGVLGAILLIFAFYSMQTLPTNYAGVALIILGILLFVAEIFTPGVGLLSLGGIVAMFLGSIILFDSSLPMMRVSMSLIWTFTLTTAGMVIFLLNAVMRVHRKRALGGQEGLIGEKGDVQVTIFPDKEGKVMIQGGLWNATADEEIKEGEKIIVDSVDGLLLKVRSYKKSQAA